MQTSRHTTISNGLLSFLTAVVWTLAGIAAWVSP
jgi:hypothetical protein